MQGLTILSDQAIRGETESNGKSFIAWQQKLSTPLKQLIVMWDAVVLELDLKICYGAISKVNLLEGVLFDEGVLYYQ